MGAQQTIESVTAVQLRDDDFFPNFSVGDTINVHYTIVEGEKERRIENAAAVVMYQKLLDEAVTGPEKRMKEVGITDEYEFGVFE